MSEQEEFENPWAWYDEAQTAGTGTSHAQDDDEETKEENLGGAKESSSDNDDGSGDDGDQDFEGGSD